MTPFMGHDWQALSRIHNDLYLAWNLRVPGWAMESDMRPYRVRLNSYGVRRLFK